MTTHETLTAAARATERGGVTAVSEVVGRLLAVLTSAMQANRILEIGTGYGLATLHMALAQPPAGRLWTFDTDIERTKEARGFFDAAGVGERIEIVNQPALEVLHIFPQRNLDIAFIDAPRDLFDEYLKQALHLLKLSGLIIFHGVHADGEGRSFAERFLRHPQLEAAIVPLGAGLAVGARKA